MWTSKKELQTALKLSVCAKGTEWAPFVEIGPSAPLTDEKEARVRGRFNGKGVMTTCCGGYETKFYFSGPCAQKIRVSYGVFKDAVAALDKRPVEMVISGGTLNLWQGADCVRMADISFGQEMETKLPFFGFDPQNAVRRWLDGRELAALTDALGQMSWLPKESGPGSEFYLENRTGSTEGLEELVLFACDGYTGVTASVRVRELGGLGIVLVPGGAASKILHAKKLLSPAGVGLTLAGGLAVFDFGRFVLSAKTFEKEFISPEVCRPAEVLAAFEFDRGQLAAFAQKASFGSHKIRFTWQRGVLTASGGNSLWSADLRAEVGLDERPQTEFDFEINAKRLLRAVKHLTAPRVWLYYAGENQPVYLWAGNIRMVVMTEKKEPKNEPGK